MALSLPHASLRTYLLTLTAGAAIPIVCFAAFITLSLGRTQQDAVERGLGETVSALVGSVDRELAGIARTLEVLALSEYLDGADHRFFAREARRVLDSQAADGWVSIHLASPDGTPLMNTAHATSGPLPLPDVATVVQAAAPRRALVSDLILRGFNGQPVFGVQVPVLRDDRVRYVLSAQVSASAMAAALRSQEDIADRIAVLYDANRRIVYRTLNSDRLVGTLVTPLLAKHSAEHPLGILDDVNREGMPVRTAYRRSALSGWTVAVGLPQQVLYAAQRRSMWTLAAVGVGIVALSGGGALLVATRIRRDARALLSTANALTASHGPVPPMATPITDLDQLGRALTVAADLLRARAASLERYVRDLERAEGERIAALGRERQAREAAEAATRAKDDFIAVLSHELRTPLNAVYGWARMLQTGLLPDGGVGRAVEAIMRNAHAQVQLIDDLLDVSRIVSGKMRLDMRPVNPRLVIEAALDAVRPAADSKAIHLDAVLDPGAGLLVGDPDRLQQVVWNLLMNAVKFTPNKGRVQVQLKRVDSHVEIVITDTGEGISPEMLPTIFDRFQQAHAGTAQRQSGLGLGLTLVRFLVEAHGGSVTADSLGQGQGATFVIRLPLPQAKVEAQVAAYLPTTAGVARSSYPNPTLEGLCVLVVDDEPDALDLATAILTTVGAEVRSCQSSAEALAICHHWAPDVLISDIEMPGEDGLTLMRQIRAMDPTRGGKMPAIALTAYGRVEDRLRALDAGFSTHLPKPVDPAQLTMVVASVAGREPHGL
jgi:signal transduction histidine kinase/ActR/RegA family two-component response regulator